MEIPTGESEQAAAEAEAQLSTQPAQTGKISVRLVLDGGSQNLSCDCEPSGTVSSLKAFVASSWGSSSDSIVISYNGETLSGTTTMDQLGAEPGQSIDLQVQSTHPPPPDTNEGDAPTPAPSIGSRTQHMPDVFTVQVAIGKDTREVLLRVEKFRGTKPFLGGYKHRVSGIEYHHASAQTIPKRTPASGVPKFQRDTQTVITTNRRQQVSLDAATQMDKTGCFVNDEGERELPVGLYETADEYHQRILEKVLVLQTYWRRWLSMKYVDALRKDKLQRAEWEKQEAIRKQKERQARTRWEFERRMNPQTKEDFELLYHALEMWRRDELKHINATTSGPERKAALCALLEQEAQLIASIGRHKNVASHKNKDRDTRAFLDKMAAPKRWIAFDGNSTEMDTPYTLRAQQLRDIYNSITLGNLSRDERLDVLLTLKCTVKEHDCKLTREIVELVDREADLLVRGIGEGSLEGLRKRISTLFYQYCKTPLFNAEAARHIKVPQDPSILRSNVYYCRSCCQYLPSTDFELSTNSRVVGHCRQCKELDNIARGREDHTLYRAMLRDIRKSEESYKDQSHIVFLLQESDLRYLVENIWGCQSILSAAKDVYELTLARWDRREQWSPWNCILITKDEARGHNSLESVEEAYGSQFVRKVHHRHVLARSYFSRIQGMLEEMRSKVEELPLPRPQERVIVPTATRTLATETTPPTVAT